MSYNSLYQPFNLHDLKLTNRIALAPMTRSRAGKERIPNRLMAEYYAQRSAAGLLITEGWQCRIWFRNVVPVGCRRFGLHSRVVVTQ